MVVSAFTLTCDARFILESSGSVDKNSGQSASHRLYSAYSHGGSYFVTQTSSFNCTCSAQGDIQGLVSMNLHSATQWSHCYCRTGTKRLLNKRQIHLSLRLDTAEFLPSPTVCQGLPPFARLYVRIYRSDRFTCATIDLWVFSVCSCTYGILVHLRRTCPAT